MLKISKYFCIAHYNLYCIHLYIRYYSPRNNLHYSHWSNLNMWKK